MISIKDSYSDSSSTILSQDSESVGQFAGNSISLHEDAPVELIRLKRAIPFIQRALNEEITPLLVDDCTGGTYMCFNEYDGVEAVFKPLDEEPYCINNPKGLLPLQYSSNDRSITPGTSCLREVAAYYLDHFHLAGVPETALVSITYENSYEVYQKEGSLQLFVPHECSSEDYGSSLFSLQNIQSIALLDIRLFNLDRHENNLLVCNMKNRRSRSFVEDSLFADWTLSSPCVTHVRAVYQPSTLHLVPIDHGYALPCVTTRSIPQWCWINWCQSKAPLCEEVKQYIQMLDVESDIALLRAYLPTIEESALDTLRVTTMWLKLCADANLTFNQIGRFFLPKEVGQPSHFQNLVALYSNQMGNGSFADFLIADGTKYMLSILSIVCA